MKALVLFSGGLDSLATVAAARREERELALLHIRYGQAHGQAELRAAALLADALGVPLEVAELPGMALVAPVGKVVPARNLVFLAYAAGVAAGRGIPEVWIGACGADAPDFPDCRPAFLTAAEHAIQVAGLAVRVRAPLAYMSKGDTFMVLQQAGLLEAAIAVSHTCYQGDHATRHAWGYGCGTCASCTTRAAGFAAFERMRREEA